MLIKQADALPWVGAAPIVGSLLTTLKHPSTDINAQHIAPSVGHLVGEMVGNHVGAVVGGVGARFALGLAALGLNKLTKTSIADRLSDRLNKNLWSAAGAAGGLGGSWAGQSLAQKAMGTPEWSNLRPPALTKSLDQVKL